MDETKNPNPVPVVQPPNIVSTASSKEGVSAISVTEPQTNILEAAGPEVRPVVNPEAQQAGVEVVSENPSLTQQHITAGIDHSPVVQPVITQPTGIVQLPSKEEVVKELKEEPKGNSKYGMLLLILKALGRIAVGE